MMTTKTFDKSLFLETEHFRFVADASELGLRPGEWPQQIKVPIGNGQPFYMLGYPTESWTEYKQEFGCVHLRIYNA